MITGKSITCVLVVILLGFGVAHGAEPSGRLSVTAVRTQAPPLIDGNLTDDIWQATPGYSDFRTFQPSVGESVSEKTTAYAAYDRHNLYFAFECRDSDPAQILANLTKRDDIFGDDYVAVILDTYYGGQGGYAFFVNPLGIQGDTMLDEVGDGSGEEDYIWESAATMDDRGYTVEIMIPLQSIRFPRKAEVIMGIIFDRQIPRYSEKSTYPAFDPNKGVFMRQTAAIAFKDLHYQRPIEVLPAITHSADKDVLRGGIREDTNFGVTAKVGLTPSLALDGTLYPDFSHVESDASQIEFNKRSAVIYPEKRPFFLEGSEHFDVAGLDGETTIETVVHTRKIVDPVWGLKLSGNLTQSQTICALAARDESPEALEDTDDDAHFGILRYKHLLGRSSYFGGIITDRELGGTYNRVFGVDGRYAISGTTQLEFNYLYVGDRPESSDVDYGHSTDVILEYGDEYYTGVISFHDVSEDVDLATGFIDRDGIRTLGIHGSREFYLESERFQRLTLAYWGMYRRDKYYDKTERKHDVTVNVHMPYFSILSISYVDWTEVYADRIFDTTMYGFTVSSQPIKQVEGTISFIESAKPAYFAEDPYQGDEAFFAATLVVKPTEKLGFVGSWLSASFRERATEEKIYGIDIYRGKIIYQPHKYFFLRGIVEHDDFVKTITTDLLLSFTYVPGTVLHIGYGSLYEDIGTEDDSHYKESTRKVFIKASYNWRW
jgi:hypothetical protein